MRTFIKGSRLKVSNMKELKISVFKESERKKSIATKLQETLSSSEVEEAKNDWHAKRIPRPCGLTVHTGIGCDYACTYCYIPDMGFPFKAKPYPLSGKQLTYAISINPAISLGNYGTFLAFGSVTEPFLNISKNKTFEYLKNAVEYLKNPTQISTKSYLSKEDAFKLKEVVKGKLSILVTIITLKHHKLLEPKAPSPRERFETLENLRKAGFNPVLFFRPIIPGINDLEFESIISEALSYGVNRVLIGSLRISRRTLMKLGSMGLNVSEIEKRIPRKPRGKEQITVKTYDIKLRLQKVAEKYGVKLYYQACQVCSEDFNVPCWMPCTLKYKCTRGINVIYDVNEIREFLKTQGFHVRKIVDKEFSMEIHGNIDKYTESFLRWVFKKKVIVKKH